MKTTLDIPEPLYREVKVKAAKQGVTLREFLLGAIQRGLDPLPVQRGTESHFELDASGIPLLKRPGGDPAVVTKEFLRQLREQEGI